MKHTLTFLLALLITSIAVGQNDLKKVAVWETKCTDGSITKFQSVMVRGGMEAAVANAPGYTGFDRASFDAIIKEHNFQRSGAVNDSDIKRLGEMAGVQYIIVPEAMAQGTDFYIIVKMLDVESGEFGAAYEELCSTSASDIKNACAILGSKLFNIPYTGGGNSSGSSASSGDGSIIGQILAKVLTNVSATLDGGGSHIGDTDKPGLVLQYDASGSLYCGGYGYDANTTNIVMYVAADGYEITNCPGGWAFVGKWKNNKKEGDGLVYDRDGNLIYSGKFSNDKPTETYPDSYARTVIAFNAYDMGNGDYYIGETIEGVLDGCGLYVWNDGDAWWGFWKEGVQNGPGIMMNYDGSYQTGTWKDGKMISAEEQARMKREAEEAERRKSRSWTSLMNVKGKFYNDGGGSYHLGQRNGIAIHAFGNPFYYYFGEWNNGFEGYGMMIAPEGYEIVNCPGGWVYVGSYNKKGEMECDRGTIYNREGKIIYYGPFRKGRPTGVYPSKDSYPDYTFDVINYDNGDKYIGERKNEERNGVGFYIWGESENAWFGQWKDKNRNGFGIYVYKNGKYYTGTWKDNQKID